MLSDPINYHHNQTSHNHPLLRTMSTKRGLAAMGNGANDGGHNDEDHLDKKFKVVSGDGDEDDDDDDDDEGPKNGKRAGRRKIEIRYIEDKSRRHITFSKRKSGIMKKVHARKTFPWTSCNRICNLGTNVFIFPFNDHRHTS